MNNDISMLNRSCPICYCTKGIRIRTINMNLPTSICLPAKYDVVICEKCGFAFADTEADQDTYNLYYETNNMYSDVQTLGNKEVTDKTNRARCELLEKYIDKEAHILDIGCGSGGFLIYLKQKGYKHLMGLDPSEKSIAILRENGISGKVGNIFDKVSEEDVNCFDVVISTSVIEHIYNLNDYTRQIKTFLKPQGFVYLDAPAVEGFEKYIAKIPNYFNHEHINYFSLVSLDNLMKKVNFIRVSSERDSYFRTEANFPELAIGSVYCLKEGEERIKKDEKAIKSIQNYFEKVEVIEKEQCAVIREKIDKCNSKIVIWGTGSFTMQLLAQMPELCNKVAYFVDNNHTKQGMQLLKLPVYLPEYLVNDENKYPIMICSMNNAKDIEAQILQMNLDNSFFIA